MGQANNLLSVVNSNSHHNQGSAAHTRIKQISQRIQSPVTSKHPSGFTIVELLIVIVVIAVLAMITMVVYTNMSSRAAEATLQSDLTNASKQLGLINAKTGAYPSPGLPADVKASSGNHFQYNTDGTSYCLTAIPSNTGASTYHISNTTSVTEGSCSGHHPGGSGGTVATGSLMQTITNANCPTTRTRAVDARDNHTYWVQELADGKCWMLTNLAYAGGGTNSNGDTKTLTEGTATSYTVPHYYIPTGASPTSGTADPSTSTNGTGQYGYLYNFCAANGGQAGNGACSSTSDAAVDTSVSVCPAGWRLPTGGTGGELEQLTTAIGATNNAAGATALQQVWLAQRGGYWNSGFYGQGSVGSYWSSSQSSVPYGFRLYFNSSTVYPANAYTKVSGFSVRCVAV